MLTQSTLHYRQKMILKVEGHVHQPQGPVEREKKKTQGMARLERRRQKKMGTMQPRSKNNSQELAGPPAQPAR